VKHGGPAGQRVFIVGGGPAGAAAALSLARTGLTPVVLEAQPEPELKVGECLPPSVNPLLERLGLVDTVSRVGLPSHGNRYVWGSAEPSERDFIFGAAGVGWQLDRRKFEEELAAAAIQAGTDWRYGRRLVGCSLEEHGGQRLAVKSEKGLEIYRADFVIDASGRAARLARLLGRQRIRYDRLVGVSAYLQRESGGDRRAEDSRTLVEAAEEGWWYSAPLPGGRLIAAYMTDADLVGLPPSRRQDVWSALLDAAPHTRERIRQGSYRASTAPRILGAQTSRLSAVVGVAWLAAGDAAVTYDPLTSHGITAALGSGLCAGAAAADYLNGRHRALSEYASLVDRAFAQYLILHHDRYLGERRWPDSIFWRRRHMHADAWRASFTLN
jgi:flavin-dependent dehydrogenase